MSETPRSSEDFFLQRAVTSPIGDKAMAVLLALWSTRLSIRALKKGLGLPLTLLYASSIVLNTQILVRRTPSKVSLNPWSWLLTLASSCHFLLYGAFLNKPAPPIAPRWFNNLTAIAGMVLLLWARVSMGLNFGFVPALRRIVTGGPFRLVRHPVYAGLSLMHVARSLDHKSMRSCAIGALGIGLWALKAVSEEAFLKEEEEYRRFMERTRWRMIPHVF